MTEYLKPIVSTSLGSSRASHVEINGNSVSDQERRLALLELGFHLKGSGYDFTTITPATHGRVAARDKDVEAAGFRDVFGWSRPFRVGLLPKAIDELIRAADLIVPAEKAGFFVSRVRFACLDGELFVHSAWPTVEHDAVFFGPDTYRFANFVRSHLPQREALSIVDVGCGTGAVGLLAARWLQPRSSCLQLLDINARALDYSWVNARLCGNPEAMPRKSDLLAEVEGAPDLVLCNPPYLPDAAHRVYRDGGGNLGTGLSLRLVREALFKLAPKGLLLLYTGTAVVNGEHVFFKELGPLLRTAAQERSFDYQYGELDPDVFGEELADPAYGEVERIAAVGLALQLL